MPPCERDKAVISIHRGTLYIHDGEEARRILDQALERMQPRLPYNHPMVKVGDPNC